MRKKNQFIHIKHQNKYKTRSTQGHQRSELEHKRLSLTAQTLYTKEQFPICNNRRPSTEPAGVGTWLVNESNGLVTRGRVYLCKCCILGGNIFLIHVCLHLYIHIYLIICTHNLTPSFLYLHTLCLSICLPI